MNKKITSSVLAAVMIAGTTSFSAFAAMANGTVVIGNKAFDLAYANDPTNAQEITNAIVASGVVYVKDFQGNWIDNTTGLIVNASVIPAVTYKSATGVETKFDAKDADVVTTAAVTSVSAINLKTVQITFSVAVDKDALGTITLKDSLLNTVALDATQGTVLSADGKVLTLAAAGQFTQGAEYSLKIEGAKSVAGLAVTKYDSKFTALDTMVPVVSNASITSPKTIEIGFNETVTSSMFSSGMDNFAGVLTNLVQIDGVNAYVDDITMDYSTGKMQLRLNNALTSGTHTIKVMGFKDIAGFPIAEKEFTATLATDTIAPSVAAVSVIKYDKVRVTFDEVINAPVAGNFSLSIGGSTITVASVAAVAGDQKSYDLTLNSALGLGAVVDASLKYKDIKDFYNNSVVTEKTFSFKAIDETVLPTVTSSVLNHDNTVTLTFSEDIEGLTTADLELYDKDSKLVSSGITGLAPVVVNNVASKKAYDVTLASSVNVGGNYSLKLKKESVNDFSIRKNTNIEQTFALSTLDAVKPNATNPVQVLENGVVTVNSDSDALDTKLTIFFDEVMDRATLQNSGNYLINNAPIDSSVTINPAQDGKSVELVINRTAPSAQLTFVTGQSTLQVLGLKDVAGNMVNQFNTILPASNYVATNTIINTVQLVAKNQVKIMPVGTNVIASVNLNNIQVIDTDTTTVYAQATRVVSYNTDGSVTVEMSRDLNTDTLAKEVVGTDIAIGSALRFSLTADGVKNVQGQIQALTNGSFVSGITDKAKASFVLTDALTAGVATVNGKADVNDANNSITLAFDENVYADANEIKSALVIKNKDGVRLATTAYSVSVPATAIAAPSKNVVITLTAPATVDYVGNYTITLADNVVLKDIAGNNANDIVTITTDDLTVENAAGIAAQLAVTNAQTAKTAADAEVVTATTAKTTADTAVVTATTAKTTADEAVVTTTTAKTAADAEVVTATTAKTAADTAVTNDDGTDPDALIAKEATAATAATALTTATTAATTAATNLTTATATAETAATTLTTATATAATAATDLTTATATAATAATTLTTAQAALAAL